MITFAHTDFYNYFLQYNKNEHTSSAYLLNDMYLNLMKISKKKLIIPTYNYNFPKKKIFNFKKDKSHVGTFSNYFLKKFVNFRTKVPIFSTCNSFKFNFHKEPKLLDPFGEDSEFDYLYRNNGKIVNFGASFAPTFIMYIERSLINGAFYRYGKFFKGKTLFKGKLIETTLYYEVRPKKIKIEYNLNKIKKLLIKYQILKIIKNENNFVYEEIDAKKFKDLLIKKLMLDPYYLLTNNTIEILKKKNFYNFKKFNITQFES